ncbi:MAG: sulfatase-like hydrolase/transferase, partial [Planctomycetes bacterium]|nr:sulfatase-like hydrolase/transferase [Planctomycetota bacterium]
MSLSNRCSLSLCMLLLLLAAPSPADDSARPNFLIIIADDLNWQDLGCTGNPDVKTPHIDQLSRDGMSLQGMFTPAPTCSPCRHALYTGLFPVRSGAYPNHTMVDPGTRSIFSHLKAAGYRVGLQAKTHVQPPGSFPFEYISPNADDAKAFAA